MKHSRRALFQLVSIITTLASGARADEPEPKALPKVLLVGDSIRIAYQGLVAKNLDGKAVVTSPSGNCGDSSNIVKNLDAWVIKKQPDIVHFNCGIHDTKFFAATGKFQVSPEEYEANLRKIVERIRKETKATVIFATTTPILTDAAKKARTKADYELTGANVERYNSIALKVMKELDVPVNDLHGVFPDKVALEKVMMGDGTHFGDKGSAALAETVAKFIEGKMPIAK